MGSPDDSMGFNITLKKKKVFLGGTCNGSVWRDELSPLLGASIAVFNPVVPVWDDEANRLELAARSDSDFVLYTITPKMEGPYSIAEVVDDSNKRPGKTLFCFLDNYDGAEFTKHQVKALEKIATMVKNNGGKAFGSLAGVSEWLNSA